VSTSRAVGSVVVLCLLLLGVERALRPARAEPRETARLLVRCEREAVGRVVQALAGLGVEVHDLDSMERLDAEGARGPAPERPPSPAPPDARGVYAVVLGALSRGEPGEARLTRLDVGPRRAELAVEVRDPARLDVLRADLNAALSERTANARIEMGAVTSLPSGWLQGRLSIRLFDLAPGVPPEGEGLELSRLQAAVGAAGLHALSVGAEQVDGGWVVRKARLARADGGDLEAQVTPLLDRLSEAFLVSEVSFDRKEDRVVAVEVVLVGRAAR
jgi:hypothetical protein